MARTSLHSVPDTNIILAAHGRNVGSPNAEYLTRWQMGEFTLLYSDDTLREYTEKLHERQVAESDILQFVTAILKLGEGVPILYFHIRHYPPDADDIAFLLCATNGTATHIITYDDHLLQLQPYYPFTICKPIPFLQAVRSELGADEQ